MNESFGAYILIDIIGTGGMAEVFVASPYTGDLRESLPPLVAIKRIRREFSGQRVFADQFIAEAKLGALLKHPNIVRIYDLGVVGTDFYFAMDWVDGKSFDFLLSKLKESDTCLSHRHVDYIFHQIVEGLAAVHEATDNIRRPLGIVHRDITPGNILLGYDGTVRITDFGLATAERSANAESKDVAFGKLHYMPPEHLKNGKIDRRSDLYSLCVLMCQSLSHHFPFEAKSQIELSEKITNSEPTLNETWFAHRKGLFDFVRQGLAKNPENRPSSVSELKDFFTDVNPEEGRKALSELLNSLFASERQALIEKIQQALRVRDQPEDIRLRSIRPSSGTSSSKKVEKTEWLPQTPKNQSTHIAFKGTSSGRQNHSVGKIEIQRKRVETRIERPKAVEEKMRVDPESDDSTIELAYPTFLGETEAPRARMDILENLQRSSSYPSKERSGPKLVPSSPKRVAGKPIFAPLLIGCLALAALSATIVGVKRFQDSRPLPLSQPISEFGLYVTVEKGSQSRVQAWINPIQEFLIREHYRLTGIKNFSYELSILSTRENLSEINWKGSFFSPGPFAELSSLFNVRAQDLAQKAILFVHVYPKEYAESPSYPIDLPLERPYRVGMLFVPSNTKEEEESIVRTAHEVLHALGAKDKYDADGRIRFPEGYGNPKQEPLHPQVFGEIMSRGIAITEEVHRPLLSLHDSRIGEQTAIEIGWLESKKTSK